MKEKELDKFLEKKLGKEVIDALDERYVMTREINPDECEQNPIIAKKQKIADFYKSLDDDEKLLLSIVLISPNNTSENSNLARSLSDKINYCKDYEDLVHERTMYLMSKIMNS